MKRWIVAITGASGSIYGLRLTERLLQAGHQVTLTITKAGREVVAYETGLQVPADASASATVLDFLRLPGSLPLRIAAADDLFNAAASGSARIDGMVVCPASMGFCASVAAGVASDLPRRAADVMLKERRQLVLVPRETPLSLIHLRNMTTLTEAGAIIAPASPGFYDRPATVDALVDFMVGKVLDLLGVEHDLFGRWGENDRTDDDASL